MERRKLSRRDILQGAATLAAGTMFASPVRAQAPEPVAITPGLVEAAKKEGKLIFYSSMDLPVGEKLGKAFEAAYPGVTVQIERSGSERLFQRIDQEFACRHPRSRCDQHLGCIAHHHLEAEQMVGAICIGRYGPAFSS